MSEGREMRRQIRRRAAEAEREQSREMNQTAAVTPTEPCRDCADYDNYGGWGPPTCSRCARRLRWHEDEIARRNRYSGLTYGFLVGFGFTSLMWRFSVAVAVAAAGVVLVIAWAADRYAAARTSTEEGRGA